MSAEAQRLRAKTLAEQAKMKEDQVMVAGPEDRGQSLADIAPRAPGVMDEQFPTASLGAKDERDEVMAAKLQLQDPGQVGYTPFGKLEAKDSDFEWYQRKVAAAEAANFQAWFAKNFDLMSPAQKKRAKELYPEFYAQRKKLLKQQAKNLLTFAKLKLEGPETFDELYKQYLAETGRLDLGPLQNLLNPEQADSLRSNESKQRQQLKFQRGLLSPFRVFGEEALPYPGEDAEGQRSLESMMFATRDVPQSTTQMGYQYGFPPMGKAFAGQQEQQQQDKQWWQMLKMPQ